jgi:hypothetical protein
VTPTAAPPKRGGYHPRRPTPAHVPKPSGGARIHTLEDVQAHAEHREAARERLIPFCTYMWDGFQVRPYRELIAGALELLERRTINRLMIFAPPQHGKSEIDARNFPAWYMGRNPDDAQIICSYNAELAYNLSFEARAKVMDPRFAAIFGTLSPYELPVEISEERAATKEWRLQNHRGRLKASGMGGGIAGHPADLVVIDDPVKDDVDIMSPITREKQIRWYKGQLYGRISPRGAICLTMTRWHEQDLAGYLLAEQADGGDLWHVLRLPAVAEPAWRIEEWCKRNNVTVDRYIVSDMLPRRAA